MKANIESDAQALIDPYGDGAYRLARERVSEARRGRTIVARRIQPPDHAALAFSALAWLIIPIVRPSREP
jgi:hypothetical protein